MSTTMPQIDASVVNKWKRYPSYKDSGVEWLGEVPEGWGTLRLKYAARMNYGDSLPSDAREDGEFSVFGSNGPVDTHSLPNTLAPVLVIGRKGSFGKLNFSDKPCFAIDTTYYIDQRQTRADIRWLFYALSLLGLDAISEYSAVPGLSREFVYEQWLPQISFAEQQAIADFLDRETAKIDALIGKREQLIELLKEKRAALISHAVTKGLDPTVKMKDSGVEWLREVPEGWIVKRLKYACQVNPSKSELADLSAETQVSFLPMELVGEDGMLSLGETRTIEQVWEGYTYFRDKDVIVAKITPCFENGKGALCNNLFNGIGFGTTELYVLRAKEGICPKYIYYLTKSRPFRALGAAMMHGTAGQQRVPDDFVKDFRLGFPSINEQQAIADFLDRETAKIDALINKIREGIEKLKEYRTALISAAVTGKIDVRGEVS